MDVDKGLGNEQAYEARGVVARVKKIGNVQIGLIQTPVFKYLTFDCGKGRRGKCAQFVSPAPRVIDELTGEEYLDMEAVEEGQIIVKPGLLYEVIPWSDALYAEHLKGLRTYRPKDLLVYDKSDRDDNEIDNVDIDLTTDSDTKHLIRKDVKKRKGKDRVIH